MIKEGVLKGAKRAPFLKEAFKDALDTFRRDVLGREDFDPTALLQFALFMAKSVINILKENEARFGIDGQKAVNDALIKTGYEVGKEVVTDVEIPEGMTPIEMLSYMCTIINTEVWASIEEPIIEDEKNCSFNIHWCPLQDIYKAFDCRVQRYMVQGVINAFREYSPFGKDYQLKFTKTIPAGGDICRFLLKEREPGDPDDWEDYSRLLEKRAMKRMKERQKCESN